MRNTIKGDKAMPGGAMLEIVDDSDTVIGVRSREEIYILGLRHREVHVWLITPENEIVFQRRSPAKDTFPNLLDASVGGHVEVGQTYEQAAVAEAQEEAGLLITPSQLRPLVKLDNYAVDERLNKRNLTFRQTYWLPYTGSLDELQVEAGEAVGFVALPASTVFSLTPGNAAGCIPGLFQDDYLPCWRALRHALA
jgi:8-oxo-dGTP pyrophosphatase MutT (NUDIX family)